MNALKIFLLALFINAIVSTPWINYCEAGIYTRSEIMLACLAVGGVCGLPALLLFGCWLQVVKHFAGKRIKLLMHSFWVFPSITAICSFCAAKVLLGNLFKAYLLGPVLPVLATEIALVLLYKHVHGVMYGNKPEDSAIS